MAKSAHSTITRRAALTGTAAGAAAIMLGTGLPIIPAAADVGGASGAPLTVHTLLKTYNTWLFYERRLLCNHMYPGNRNMEQFVPLANRASEWAVRNPNSIIAPGMRTIEGRANCVLLLSSLVTGRELDELEGQS